MKGKHAVWLGALLLLAGLFLVPRIERGTREVAGPTPPELVSPAASGEPLVMPAPVEPAERAVRVGATPVPEAEEHATPVPEIEPERTLVVRVVDSRGVPQPDVSVHLRIDAPRSRSWSGKTDGRGRAAFGLGDTAQSGERALATASVGLFEPRCEAEVPLTPWPAEPLEIVLPDHGAVVVQVVDETGAPRTDSGKVVRLRVERELAPGAELWDSHEGTLHALLEDGRARFPGVGLGLSLRASIDARPQAEMASVEFHGPARSGEEVFQRLEARNAPTVLLFRALDESGTPLARAELGAALTRTMPGGGGFGSGGFTVETDELGRARLPLQDPWQEGQTLTLRLQQRSKASRAARVDLSRAFPAGESDLGDIRLREPAVLLGGHVVDQAGAPVAGTTLIARQPGGAAVLHASCGPDGSFAFHDDEVRGELRLSVLTKEFVQPEPFLVASGTRDLRIVLERGGTIAGSLAASDGLSMPAFLVAAQARNERVAPGLSFALRGLSPPSVDVALRLEPGNVLLLEVPNVVVLGGETTRDARLQEIDLARLIAALRIRVRLPDGRPAADGWVRVMTGAEREAAFLIEAGEALVIGRAGPLDLEVQVPGCRIERLARVERDTEVRLQSAFRVRLELASDVELPPAGSSLQVRLIREAEPGEAAAVRSLQIFRGGEMMGSWNDYVGDQTNSFGVSREVLASVQEPGTYSVALYYVIRHGDGATMSWSLDTAEKTSFELDESDADETFRVAPDPQSYAELRAGRR